MTALEAYALAKKIAASAVSGIKSLTVNGTTLTIETNDGNTIDMVFPVPADGRGITHATIDSNYHLIITYDDGTTEDAGEIPGADVDVTQILSSGTKIASIAVNGVATDLFAPEGGSGGDYYIIDTIAERPSDLTSDDRAIYYCIADSIFYLWNGTEWKTISAGVKIRELTKEQYEALTPEEKMDGTIYFVTDEGGGGGGSSELATDMTVTKAVGGITVGTQYTAGTSLETILRDMLAPVLYPTFTNPSASISATGAKLLETGSSLNTTMTITFNRGTINPAYGTSGKRAGIADDYMLNGGTAQASNTFSVTVTSAQLTYQGTVNYEAGEQPKDSAGNNYSTPLPAGSVNTNTITYEFVDAMYANTSSAGTMTKQALVSKNTGSKQFSLPATTAEYPEQIDVPGTWTVSKIEVLNTLSGKWEDATSQFTKTTTSHDDAAGSPVSYNRYTCNLGMALGARDVKVSWS